MRLIYIACLIAAVLLGGTAESIKFMTTYFILVELCMITKAIKMKDKWRVRCKDTFVFVNGEMPEEK